MKNKFLIEVIAFLFISSMIVVPIVNAAQRVTLVDGSGNEVALGGVHATTTIPATLASNSTITLSSNAATYYTDTMVVDPYVYSSCDYTCSANGVKIQVGQGSVVPNPQNQANASFDTPVNMPDIVSNSTTTAIQIVPFSKASLKYLRFKLSSVGAANNTTCTINYYGQN